MNLQGINGKISFTAIKLDANKDGKPYHLELDDRDKLQISKNEGSYNLEITREFQDYNKRNF